ncbi:MAG: hypothetical protein HY822_17100 [Acidobacteria bacterium]|nr:hypothetical protein [Acidobacteriota bacterium]
MERNGQFAGAPMTPALTDCTVTPGQTYTYRFYVLDRHVNWAPATDVTVTAGGGAGLPPGILAPDAVRLGRDLRAHLFAWKLLAGALTPIWSGYELSYFLFTDSTGAEYRLDVNEGGVWRSRQGVYVFYDANTARLNSPDGSHWHMSAG